ncbi:MAG: response regulator [Deltaproteobacteria bacterium]|nr:response regulator [Deltaproteobacteria bacterium]
MREVEQVEEFRVLLVDDEKDFVDTLLKRLEKRKLAVRAATSGRGAIAALRESPADVIVLDMKMPDMDGMETLKEIKKLDPGLEVIILTGHANVEVAVEGLELGAFDYLMKPVEIDELLYKLQDAYKRKWCREEDDKCRIPDSLTVT